MKRANTGDGTGRVERGAARVACLTPHAPPLLLRAAAGPACLRPLPIAAWRRRCCCWRDLPTACGSCLQGGEGQAVSSKAMQACTVQRHTIQHCAHRQHRQQQPAAVRPQQQQRRLQVAAKAETCARCRQTPVGKGNQARGACRQQVAAIVASAAKHRQQALSVAEPKAHRCRQRSCSAPRCRS